MEAMREGVFFRGPRNVGYFGVLFSFGRLFSSKNNLQVNFI